MRINHRSIRKFSGPVVYGTEVIQPTSGPFHAGRAFWLTGQVETGNRLGSVMMADGTGFTIGIDQHIAVYPRELAHEDFNAEDDQGGAWLLLAALETAHAPVRELWEALEREGWYIAPDGSLRWIDGGRAKVKNRVIEHRGGDLVHGAVIRDTITPKSGVVEKGSPAWTIARKWAEILHNLTQAPSSRDVQVAFGVKHLIHRVRTRKLRLADHRRRVTLQQAVYGSRNIETLHLTTLGPKMDLAMCVFHAYTVNAPSVAFRLLEDTIKGMGGFDPECEASREVFAGAILLKLKRKKYGFWDKRWARTRKAAMEVGWWDASLFKRPTGIMTP